MSNSYSAEEIEKALTSLSQRRYKSRFKNLDPQQWDEVIQKARINIYRSWPMQVGYSGFNIHGFVYGAVQYATADLFRKEKRHRTHFPALNDDALERCITAWSFAHSTSNPETLLLERHALEERKAKRESALVRLSPRDRQIVRLRLDEGWRTKRIAIEMGVSDVIVRKVLQRALKVIRDYMVKEKE